MTFPEIGSKAPLFTLLNQNAEEVDLRKIKDKTIIIYFYPKASTPGCTVQACGMRDIKKELAKAGTVIFGISPDLPSKLKKFLEKEKLNFDLLSDPEHLIAEKYGVWGQKKFMGREYMGIKRISFIIGTDGKLKHIINEVKTKTHHDEVLSLVTAL